MKDSLKTGNPLTALGSAARGFCGARGMHVTLVVKVHYGG